MMISIFGLEGEYVFGLEGVSIYVCGEDRWVRFGIYGLDLGLGLEDLGSGRFGDLRTGEVNGVRAFPSHSPSIK